MQSLEGVRIADFTWAVAGPYATQLLAFLGAQVIKIESRQRLDIMRKLGRTLGWADQGDAEKSVEFNLVNLNKLGLTLDLANPRAEELAKRLVAVSDVVVQNFSPGVMDKLGLGYEALRQVRPDLIMLSISAAGATGPERRALGYASIFHAVGGQAYLTGYPDSPPGYIRAPIDCNVGSVGALAVLAALVHRQNTGQGQHIDLSARETVSHLIGHAFLQVAMNGKDPERTGNRDSSLVPHNCYPCRGEDRWVSIAVGTEGEWQALVRAMGDPAWARDFVDPLYRYQHREELDQKIGEWTRNYEAYELMGLLQGAGVAAMPVFSAQEVFGDPHLAAREILEVVEHPEQGSSPVLRPPWRLSASPPQVLRHGPLLDQDRDYVLGELLGLSPEEISRLEAEGVLE